MDRAHGILAHNGQPSLRCSRKRENAGYRAGIVLQALGPGNGIKHDGRHDRRIPQVQAIRWLRLIRIDLTGENPDLARTAIIPDNKIVFPKAMHRAPGGICVKDIHLHRTGGRFQYDRLWRLRVGPQNRLQEKRTDSSPPVHSLKLFFFLLLAAFAPHDDDHDEDECENAADELDGGVRAGTRRWRRVLQECDECRK